MKLAIYGINHHTCPVSEREKLNFSHDEQVAILRQMHAVPDMVEALILNTCNRFEVYVYTAKAFDAGAFVSDLVAQHRPGAGAVWKEHCHEHFGINVVKHLFTVAAGLDSQIPGENQIVAQLKAAYAFSLECHTSKFLMHRLMHMAFHVAKAVRTQTDINCGSVSISLAAVDFSKKQLGTMRKGMVIGAGETAELAADYLIKEGLEELIVANRKADTAHAMVSRLGMGSVIALDEIAANLGDVDVVIASTGAVEAVMRYADVKDVLTSRKRELLIIDIAVPRDIDPQIGEIPGVRLYNIDDLNGFIDANIARRGAEVPKAAAIVDEHVGEFSAWLDSLTMVPVITELTSKIVQIARTEAKRYAGEVGVPGDKLELFAESLARKILHGPIRFLKTTGDEEPNFEQLEAVNLINRMFLGSEGAKGQ